MYVSKSCAISGYPYTGSNIYGKPFYYLFYKSNIWFNISDVLYNVYDN